MGVPYAEVIGDPIAHSKSPLIHEFWLAKLGLDYDYRATRVGSADLADFLETRKLDPDWCGCNVTLPHKQTAAELVAELVPPAKALRAVNCITREGAAEPALIGSNTDVAGFLEPLRPWLAGGETYRFGHVFGTGGAALAASYALDRAGVTVVNYGRSRDKALVVRRRLELWDDHLACDMDALDAAGDWEETRSGERLDILVNATPLGMTGYPPLPVNLAGCPPGTLVYDLVYAPLETPLLRAARARSMPMLGGLTMLIGQAAAAFELFFMQAAPREHDGELLRLLSR
jgi:shikimate dehydrogenase